MYWNGTNLEEVLKRTRQKEQQASPDEVLNAFKELIRKEDQKEDRIRQDIFSGSEACNKINYRSLNPENIFTESQIKKLCILYRLRFLPARYFKGNIPYEAISKVKQLHRNGSEELGNFRILAPAPVFNLRERDKDPLLFLTLGNGRYYLVHKWGADLNPLRRILVFPFRSFRTLLSCVAGLALLVVMSIPDSIIMGPYDATSLNLRVIFFFYLFIAFSGLTVLYGFSRLKNFNGALWNSRYLD